MKTTDNLFSAYLKNEKVDILAFIQAWEDGPDEPDNNESYRIAKEFVSNTFFGQMIEKSFGFQVALLSLLVSAYQTDRDMRAGKETEKAA